MDKGEEHVSETICHEAIIGGKPLVTDKRVPGRILGHHKFYESIGAEPYIVKVVREGYRLVFDSELPSSFKCLFFYIVYIFII